MLDYKQAQALNGVEITLIPLEEALKLPFNTTHIDWLKDNVYPQLLGEKLRLIRPIDPADVWKYSRDEVIGYAAYIDNGHYRYPSTIFRPTNSKRR